MESLLQERASASTDEGLAASISRFEQLRDFRASFYGANSQKVEQSTRELAGLYAKLGRWPQAVTLYRKTIDISDHRNGGRGRDYVQLLDSIASECSSHGDQRTALELNQQALQHAAGFYRAEDLRAILEKHRKEIQSRIPTGS